MAAAQSKFRQVIELDPDMVSGYVALGQIMLLAGSPAESAAMLTAALEREPDDLQALKLSFDAGRLSGNTEMAAHALDRLVELDPNWIATVLFEHGAELFNADQAANAAFVLSYVVKADPELARATSCWGWRCSTAVVRPRGASTWRHLSSWRQKIPTPRSRGAS